MRVTAPTPAVARTSSAAEPTPLTIGPWRLVRLLGEGESCQVYQAAPLETVEESSAHYAVKRLRPPLADNRAALAQLQNEAFVAAAVSHPHVASVLAAHVDRPPYYLVLPYQPGDSLGNCLRRCPRFPLAQSLWFARQVAEGLAALHEQQWIHGDLKPENIQVAANGHATLYDLGLARRADREPHPPTALIGSVAYLPPEAFADATMITPAFDAYSLGVMLFEMLTGQRPFAAEDPAELVAAHRLVRAPDPRIVCPDVPANVAHLVRRLMAKEPLRRPTGAELVNWLVNAEIDCFEWRHAA